MKNSILAVAVMVMAILTAFAVVSTADVSDAVANHSVEGDDTTVVTGGELDFEAMFTETEGYASIEITYTAKLVNGDGDTESNKVSPSSGSMDSGSSVMLTVTAPSDAGRYFLKVEFTEEYVDADGEEQTKVFEDEVAIKVIEPVKLSVTVENLGDVALDGVTVYWYVDGKIVEDSDTDLSVAAGSKETITYSYDPSHLSSGKHTFHVETASGNYVKIDGLGVDQTFYYDQGNYDYLNYIMFAIFVIIVVVTLYVYTRPVKNYGKPKSRR